MVKFKFRRSILFILAIAIVLILGRTQTPPARSIKPQDLQGTLSLTLQHGVWKFWEDKPVYQNLTLDLVCPVQTQVCESEIWGYAPSFNKDVDHHGTVEITRMDRLLQLEVKLAVQSHPSDPRLSEAVYKIQLVPHQNQLLGTYRGKYRGRRLGGSVTGTIDPYMVKTQPVEPITTGEHPRLVFRTHQLDSVRQQAQTDYGRAVIGRLNQSLAQPIQYGGYVPNGGYHAAGHCFLSLLETDSERAQLGWQIAQKAMKNPAERLLEQSSNVAGVALAYDLCYGSWNESQRQQTTRWLAQQSVRLLNGDSPKRGWNGSAWSNWNARARGAAGLAALAILNEPDAYFPANDPFFPTPESAWQKYQIAQRNIIRYLDTAIGDRAFGTEGDHYTTEPMILTLLPFLAATLNVTGTDLVTQSNAEWILPHYVQRLISTAEGIKVPAYGRYYLSPNSSLFATGFGTLPPVFLPGVKWFFDRHYGTEGDRTYGVDLNLPHTAIYALVSYPYGVEAQNPVTTQGLVIQDSQKGFYSFRDRYQDENDFVASIYLKHEPLGGSWTFDDIGSFRIWGLGHQWATAGGEGAESDPRAENIVIMPQISFWKQANPIFSQAWADGSGVVSLRTTNQIRRRGQSMVDLHWLRSFAVDYSGTSGAPALFAIVDRFEGDVTNPLFEPKIWQMHTSGTVEIGDHTFTITADNNTTMQGTFITPDNVQIYYQSTETGGVITAIGGQSYFVVMSVQNGDSPKVDISGVGLNSVVKVGGQTITFSQNKINLDSYN